MLTLLPIARKIIKGISLILFSPILKPITFCPYPVPWIACSSCFIFYCPAKRLRNPILYLIIASIILFGRLFCSFFCPAGTIQDITNSISRRISGPDYPLYSNPLIRYPFLILILFLSFNLEGFFFPFGYYFVFPLFMIFLFLSSFKNRYWCKMLCPIGTIASFGNILSPFRIKRDKKICKDCNVCEKSCPVQTKPETLSCITCYDCLFICKNKAISLGYKKRQCLSS